MNYLVVSCSLNPDSLSRILAKTARDRLTSAAASCDYLDLAQTPLPHCDGASAYEDPVVKSVALRFAAAHGILLATPIYNYDASSVAKNLVELTGGDGWGGKVVGFLCAAGGEGSYMSIMGLANSLMLDFRTIVIPRFVYATDSDFADGRISSEKIRARVDELCAELIRFTTALAGPG